MIRESACSPICVSLISDLFSEKSRGVATGVLHLGVYVGFGLSQACGIYLTRADLFGWGWRSVYILTGLPGITTVLTNNSEFFFVVFRSCDFLPSGIPA